MNRQINFNYCIYRTPTDGGQDKVIASGSANAKTPRGMRQTVTKQAPTGAMLGSDWSMASDNEYLRYNNDYTCYIHVTSWGNFSGLDLLWYSPT